MLAACRVTIRRPGSVETASREGKLTAETTAFFNSIRSASSFVNLYLLMAQSEGRAFPLIQAASQSRKGTDSCASH
jgi:hypothetical protein